MVLNYVGEVIRAGRWWESIGRQVFLDGGSHLEQVLDSTAIGSCTPLVVLVQALRWLGAGEGKTGQIIGGGAASVDVQGGNMSRAAEAVGHGPESLQEAKPAINLPQDNQELSNLPRKPIPSP